MKTVEGYQVFLENQGKQSNQLIDLIVERTGCSKSTARNLVKYFRVIADQQPDKFSGLSIACNIVRQATPDDTLESLIARCAARTNSHPQTCKVYINTFITLLGCDKGTGYVRPGSRMNQAYQIYTEGTALKWSKDRIISSIEQLGLTRKTAITYYSYAKHGKQNTVE